MAKHGKKYLEALSKVNKDTSYDPLAAVTLDRKSVV